MDPQGHTYVDPHLAFYIANDPAETSNYKNNPYVRIKNDHQQSVAYVDKGDLIAGITQAISQANLMLGMKYDAGSFNIEGQTSAIMSSNTNVLSKITQLLNDQVNALNNKLSQAVDSISKAYDFCYRTITSYVSNR